MREKMTANPTADGSQLGSTPDLHIGLLSAGYLFIEKIILKINQLEIISSLRIYPSSRWMFSLSVSLCVRICTCCNNNNNKQICIAP